MDGNITISATRDEWNKAIMHLLQLIQRVQAIKSIDMKMNGEPMIFCLRKLRTQKKDGLTTFPSTSNLRMTIEEPDFQSTLS